MYTDYLGNEIKVGDKVVFYQLKNREFYKGIISKITEKTVIIEHDPIVFGRTSTKQFHYQIIKI